MLHDYVCTGILCMTLYQQDLLVLSSIGKPSCSIITETKENG